MRSKNSHAKRTGAFVEGATARGGGFDAPLAGGSDDAEAAVDVGRAGASAPPVERQDDRRRAGPAGRAVDRAEIEHEPAVAGGEARVARGVAVDRGVDGGRAGRAGRRRTSGLRRARPRRARPRRRRRRRRSGDRRRSRSRRAPARGRGPRRSCHSVHRRGARTQCRAGLRRGRRRSSRRRRRRGRGGRRGVAVGARAAAVAGRRRRRRRPGRRGRGRSPRAGRPAAPARRRSRVARDGVAGGRRRAVARRPVSELGPPSARGRPLARPRRAHHRLELGAELIEDRQVGVAPGHGISCPWPSSIPRKVRIARVTRVRVPEAVSPSRAATSAYGQPLDDPQPHRFALVLGQSVEAADDRLADALRCRQVLDPLDLLVCQRPRARAPVCAPSGAPTRRGARIRAARSGRSTRASRRGRRRPPPGTGRGARGRW